MFSVLQEVNMKLAKFDELDSLIRGLLFIETNNVGECYYWANPTIPERSFKETYTFTNNSYPFIVSILLSLNCTPTYRGTQQ